MHKIKLVKMPRKKKNEKSILTKVTESDIVKTREG